MGMGMLWNRKAKEVSPLKQEEIRKTSVPKYTIRNNSGTQFKVPQRGYVTLYRIQALKDIPAAGVVRGDWGGWIESYHCLKLHGNSWVANEAKVLEGVTVEGNALVKDNAVVLIGTGNGPVKSKITGDCIISGDAVVISCTEVSDNARISGSAHVEGGIVGGNAVITDKAVVTHSTVVGNTIIQETASVKESVISGHVIIEGYSLVREHSVVDGISHILGKAVVGPKQHVRFQQINGKQTRRIENYEVFNGRLGHGTAPEKTEDEVIAGFLKDLKEKNKAQDKYAQEKLAYALEKAKTDNLALTAESLMLAETLDKHRSVNTTEMALRDAVTAVENEYNSYSHDIIKLIKYPLMTDPTFAPVGKFLQKLRKAKRHMDSPDMSLTEKIVDELETAFLVMESSCVKETTRSLNDNERKKLKTAGNLVEMALNDSSTEHEKTVSAKKALDYLQGIVLLPDAAVESFRVKAGLKELTA